MSYDRAMLDRIFARTGGYCHICGGGLCRNNYGKFGLRGAWEVEHPLRNATAVAIATKGKPLAPV